MPTITDAEHKEYLYLKDKAKMLAAFDSLKHTTLLEQDIDLPIKRCVAAFALLGCKPLWSCCGFDYIGQPLHKYHQYGRIYFILGQSAMSGWFVKNFCEQLTQWQSTPCTSRHMGEYYDCYVEIKNVIPQWNDKDCIHYHEPFAGYIQHLEDFLYNLTDLFADTALVHDTNGSFKKGLNYWQYPQMPEWIVCKADYV